MNEMDYILGLALIILINILIGSIVVIIYNNERKRNENFNKSTK